MAARPGTVQRPDGIPREKIFQFKLVLLGETVVGKTSLMLRFVKGQFNEYQEYTIGASFLSQTVNFHDTTVKFDIWDVAGKERYHSFAPMYYRGAQAAIVVYDITDVDTFVRAKLWAKELQRQASPSIVIALAGNKADLAAERMVDFEEAQVYAEENGFLVMETSAKTTMNVNDIFLAIAKKLAKAKQEKEAEEEKKAEEEKEAKKNVKLCMRMIQSKGQLHQRMVTIVMNGLPRAGKTTTKERLLGRILQLLEISPSTGVVEPSLKVTISELPRSSGMVSGSQWSVLSLEDESLNLVSAILQAAGDLKSKSRLASVLDHITRAFKGRPTHPSSSGASNHPPLSPSTNPQLETSEATAANVSVTLPDQLFDELLPKSWNRLHASLEDATTVHFIDTGGQPEFQEILPALLSGHSISMLLFKLHEKLKQRYQVEYVSQDGTKSQPYTASCTVEDVLFQSLATVACYGSDTTDPTLCGSVALLVGTHKDRATKDDIQAAERSLKEKVESAEYFEKNIVHYPFPSTLIFPLDNSQDSDVQTLRRVLEEIIRKRFPRQSLPAPWLLFEIALRKAGVKILTMKDCQKIAKCYGITSKKKLKEALRFLHQMCMVRYYPDVKEVKNLIICDLQILFDAITNIIVHTFTFEKVGQAGTQRFKNTGKFSLQEFQRLATSKCSDDLLPPEKLVKLLEYLHILVPVHEAGCDEYFMPCVLQVEDLDDTTFHSLPYPPLIISFECGYVPVGIFSALIVYLLQQSQQKSSALKWKIPHGATLYRNKINLRVGHDLDKVTMVARPTYFEVQYDCSVSKMHPPVHTVCSHIRKDILNGLTVVIRSRNYTCKTTPLISFYCSRPQCTPTPHIAICEGEDPSVMECSSSKEPIGLLPSHFIWFGKDHIATFISTQEQQTLPIPSPQIEETNSSPLHDGSATGECPTMIELIRFRGKSKRINIPQEIGTKYYQFGVLLLNDETGARVRTVIHKHREDAEEINLEIFEQWIAGKGKQPVTWGILVEVLYDVELTELAKGIADVKLS